MEIDLLSYINKMSSGDFVRKSWEDMSQEEKTILQTLLNGSEIDAEEFVEGDDFYKYDELTYADMNVYMFQPYFEDFEKIHTMPEEMKELIAYGGNPDEFVAMTDDEKRKYLRSLCLNIDDYYTYFEDEEKMDITQETLDQKQAQLDESILEYDQLIEEYQEDLELAEVKTVLLEQGNKKLFEDNKRLKGEIQNKQNDLNDAYKAIARLVKKLFDEKLRYLSLLSRSLNNKLSVQRIKECFEAEIFNKEDIEKAQLFFRRHGIKIVDGQELKTRVKYEGADYSKTKAYREAVKASEANAFSDMDDWQKRF